MKDDFFKSSLATRSEAGDKRKRPLRSLPTPPSADVYGKKRKVGSATKTGYPKNGKSKNDTINNKNKRKNDEDDDEDDFVGAGGVDDMDLEDSESQNESEENDDDDRETAAEKRLRLAKRYLSKLQEETGETEGEVDAADIDRDLIAERLRVDVLEQSNRVFKRIADTYSSLSLPSTAIRTLPNGKTHALAITSLCVATEKSGDTFIYSVSKSADIVKHDFASGNRLHVFSGGVKQTQKVKQFLGNRKIKHTGHVGPITAIAASSDGQFIATGGVDKSIHIWSVSENKHLHAFVQHRDTVSSLAFRQGQNQLYSSSHDRTIKLWNVDEMAYIETLFGHQDRVMAIDTLTRERCVTCGARDRTVRLWKIVEESQLVFRGGGSGEYGDDTIKLEGAGKQLLKAKDAKNATPLNENKKKKIAGAFGGSIDCVAMIDEEYFLSGSDSGAISLWNMNRKKPIYTRLRAHGKETKTVAIEQLEGAVPTKAGTVVDSELGCNWVVSLAAVPYTDMFASGSADGQIRLWKLATDKKSFSLVSAIPMAGFINDLKFFRVQEGDKTQQKEEEELMFTNTNSDDDHTAGVLYLAAAVGQEHKNGRWWRLKNVKNAVSLIRLG